MKKVLSKIKEEKGAISALVLFTILMFIVILMGVFYSITIKQKSQIESDMRIQAIYGEDVDNINTIYTNIVGK